MSKVSLMLDSGTYSAWRSKQSIDFERYIEYIHDNSAYVGTVVNLDVIPAEFGKNPTPYEVEQSAAVGFANWDQMRREGIDAMPVFHQGESFRWLERMLETGCSYVGISPANDRVTGKKMEWLDEVFQFLCGDKGYPVIKTHGFGVTAMEIMFRYPWYSADSSSWMLCSAFGSVIVPFSDQNGYDYSRSPRMISLSMTSKSGNRPKASLRPGQHLNSLGAKEKAYMTKYLESLDTGYSVDEMQNDYEARAVACARYYQEMVKRQTLPRFTARRSGLFSEKVDSWRETSTQPLWKRMKFIFTMTLSEQHNEVLQRIEESNRLVSYFYFQPSKCNLDLRQYVRTGKWIKKSDRRKVKK